MSSQTVLPCTCTSQVVNITLFYEVPRQRNRQVQSASRVAEEDLPVDPTHALTIASALARCRSEADDITDEVAALMTTRD